MEQIIDTHSHIYSEEFDNDRSDMLSRAEEAGISKIYMPNIDHASIDAMLELEQKSDICIAMMGLHPCYVKKGFEKELYIVEEWLSKRKWAAVGEIGTDLYWDKSHWEQQQEAFNIQCQWALDYDRPVVIHCRESIDETIELVQKFDGLRGVFHCFSGDMSQAKKILELGFYLGIGGVATFKNGGLDKVLPEIGLDKLVLETDAPYLAPVPYRGKRNEPAYITNVSSRVAELKSMDDEEVRRVTTANANKLFA